MKRIGFIFSFVLVLLLLCKKEAFAQTDDDVFSFVTLEHPPAYPGGISAFYQHLSDHIKYPRKARLNKVQGTVEVSFTVEKDGSLTDINVPNKLGFGLDEEAIRVIKLSKKWIPGQLQGKPVRVKYNIPIKFSLV